MKNPPPPMTFPPNAPFSRASWYHWSRRGSADLRRAALLVLPVLIEQQAEGFHVAFFKRLLYLISQFLGAMKAFDDVMIVLLSVGILPLQDVRTRAMLSGIEKQNRIAQILPGSYREIDRRDTDLAITRDLQDGDAAECSQVMILLSDWMSG
jgi:hypothetical protein